MSALSYEIKAYPLQKIKNGYIEPFHIGCGVGKRGRAMAEKKAKELLATGKYDAVFVDAYNDNEIVDDACIEFYRT